MRVRVQAPRIPLRDATQHRLRPLVLPAVAQRERLLDHVPRIRVITAWQQLLELMATPRAARDHVDNRHRDDVPGLAPILIAGNPHPPLIQPQRRAGELDRDRRIDQPAGIAPPTQAHQAQATRSIEIETLSNPAWGAHGRRSPVLPAIR
jgi:hypothetical protein